jgi:hypothetical protein
MVRNLSREFAAMTDEERRRFALERGGSAGGPKGEPAADEVVIDDPRDPDHMGRHYADPEAELGDPEARERAETVLDDEEHERAVEDERERRQGG